MGGLYLEVRLPFPCPEWLLHGWQLRFQAGCPVIDGQVDAWIALGRMGQFEETPALEDECTVTIPGTSPHCISIASYVSAGEWECDGGRVVDGRAQPGRISSFSSLGASWRRSEDKPDVAAPGQFVTAALSSQAVGGCRWAEFRNHLSFGHHIGAHDGTNVAVGKNPFSVIYLGRSDLSVWLVDDAGRHQHGDACGYWSGCSDVV